MLGFLRLLTALVILAVVGSVTWWIIAPDRLPAETVAMLADGDAVRGETMFIAGGCASCHAAPDSTGEAHLELGGGLVLKTDFGDFVVPNISMHPVDGIGSWDAGDFGNAMLEGTSPGGQHYYPSFPWTSFERMETQDVADLWAYFQTLPPVEGPAASHDLAFPFNMRIGLGVWKTAFPSPDRAVEIDASDALIARGQYIVEGPGHCGECHSPRNFGGAIDYGRWLGGAPAADGPGFVPNITQGAGGLEGWSAGDIAYYLESGFDTDFDSVGGSMVAVQENMAKLSSEDREAIAAYLIAIPPVDSEPRK
ncbi:c-type cytochrome [Amaricoccus tamworthensis]|uniref:c-type cytochrome n=1 Tax=Amaricoccus tamworthensis TaxID=57002 RepID=UPI003C7BE3EB